MEYARERMAVLAEEIFGTEQDPDQIPITDESRDKLDSLSPHWLKYRLDEQGEPISWVIVVPTQRALGEMFLTGAITERELLARSEPRDRYDALYLCSAITVPAHRRQGLALKLMREAIEAIPHTDDCLVFTWPYTSEGLQAAQNADAALGVHVVIRA